LFQLISGLIISFNLVPKILAPKNSIMSTTPRNDQDPDRSERLLDKAEDESDAGTLEDKARQQAKKLTQDSKEDNLRTDNQAPSERILDKEDDVEESTE
jgi:hypothetical protein